VKSVDGAFDLISNIDNKSLRIVENLLKKSKVISKSKIIIVFGELKNV